MSLWMDRLSLEVDTYGGYNIIELSISLGIISWTKLTFGSLLGQNDAEVNLTSFSFPSGNDCSYGAAPPER